MANITASPPKGLDATALGQALRAATADLQQVNPAVGVLRFFGLGLATLGSLALAWQSNSGWGFGAGCLLGSLAYSFWIICNHDGVHGTLTGWRWFDAIAPRLISWPILVPQGTYATIHALHHAWNAVELRDPERIQWTAAEYDGANGFQRWTAQHQWMLNVFVLGITGLIYKTFRNGLRNRTWKPQVKQQIALDIAGMVTMQGSILLGLFLGNASGRVWLRYGVMLLILERVMSVIIQGRDYLEHYGRWQKQATPLLTQLYGTRNIQTYGWVNWAMGGLPHHGIHHGFPGIPFDKLPLAQQRIDKILSDRQYPPLPSGQGYLATSWKMMRQGYALIP